MFRANLTRLAFLVGLMIALPKGSQAAALAKLNGGPGIFQTSCVIAVLTGGPDPSDLLVLAIDPLNVESFQLDIKFEPDKVKFKRIEYVSPYVKTTSPDLSKVHLGLIQDIAGSASQPPSGEVDIFKVFFEILKPREIMVFNTFASDNDFVVGLDPDTGDKSKTGPYSCVPCNATYVPGSPIPTPMNIGTIAIIVLIVIIVIGLIGYGWQRLKKPTAP